MKPQKTTIKALKNYFSKELKMKPVHNLHSCKYAFNELNKELNTNINELIYLIFENKEISNLYTHSYGFHTGNGRYIINTFQSLYYNYNNN